MEGPKRYFPTTGKTDAYGHHEILHLDALSAGFDENNKPIPYIVIAQFMTNGKIEKLPKIQLIYSSNKFEKTFTSRTQISISAFKAKTVNNNKIYYEPDYFTDIKNNSIIIFKYDEEINFDRRSSIAHWEGIPKVNFKNIEFKTLEIVYVLIDTNDAREFAKKLENNQNIYPFKSYFVGWYRLNGPDGKAVLYDEVEATQIMENCINCNSYYKFIERSKEHKTFCSKDCQVEHYGLNSRNQFSPK